MQEFIYLKFEFSSKLDIENKNRKNSNFFNLLEWLIPKGNPIFEDSINNVIIWLIEYENDSKCVIREIGLNNDLEIISLGPFKNDVGYWTDSDIDIDYIMNNFKYINISRNEFNKTWDIAYRKFNE